jgi:hypothetical protein
VPLRRSDASRNPESMEQGAGAATVASKQASEQASMVRWDTVYPDDAGQVIRTERRGRDSSPTGGVACRRRELSGR